MKKSLLFFSFILISINAFNQELGLFSQIDEIPNYLTDLKVNKIQYEEIRRNYVTINYSELNNSSFSLNLFEDNEYECIIEYSKTSKFGLVSYIGNISNQSYSSVNLVRNGLKITGYIEISGIIYSINPIDNNIHIIREIDPSLFNKQCFTQEKEYQKSNNKTINLKSKKNNSDLIFYPDDGNSIDVLVAYTSAAESAVADINAEIQAAINDANIGYTNSNINLSLNLVESLEVS